MLEIVGGYDNREVVGYQLCAFSAIRRTSKPLRFTPLMEKPLRYAGLYTRKHEMRDGQLWDVISDAPMATSFANSRFLVPWLVPEGTEWALFCDFADMLFVADPAELFALADDKYAVMVVKHRHDPLEDRKMDNQVQTQYKRKNWSSVVLWNLKHLANKLLCKEMVNTLPGRELHSFCWLDKSEIGELPLEWNWLVGYTEDQEWKYKKKAPLPKLLHYTEGLPIMKGYEDGPFAEIWKMELEVMDATRRMFPVR